MILNAQTISGLDWTGWIGLDEPLNASLRRVRAPLCAAKNSIIQRKQLIKLAAKKCFINFFIKWEVYPETTYKNPFVVQSNL